ncbi:MAG: site-2 protease family protein [Oligoflexales bacterium]|nr:site-2 protease family protein [Oligoflexales bacterium]
MNLSQGIEIASMLIALLLSLSVHEAAHAYAAKVQGDDTAERAGRLSLNPLAHIDLVGTIILPIALKLLGGVMFGWAKPVPVDIRRFKSPRWGNLIVAAAGPLANLILCAAAIIILNAISVMFESTFSIKDFVPNLLVSTALINAYLASFNMIPIPPLDGGGVLGSLLPFALARPYYKYIAPYGMLILIVLMYTKKLDWIGFFAIGYIELVQKGISLVIQ